MKKVSKNLRPTISLAFIVVVSVIMTGISFWIYQASPTSELVSSIQQNSQAKGVFSEVGTKLDDDGILKPAELITIIEDIEKRAEIIKPSLDFGGNDLEDKPLGLVE